jgi:hypothetical protein
MNAVTRAITRAGRNDRARKAMGTMCMLVQSAAVNAREPEERGKLREAVEKYSGPWNADNDPWGEHDFGVFQMFGLRWLFKFDDYSQTYPTLAELRAHGLSHWLVLTILRADEY